MKLDDDGLRSHYGSDRSRWRYGKEPWDLLSLMSVCIWESYRENDPNLIDVYVYWLNDQSNIGRWREE